SAKGRLGVPGGNQKETGTTGPISSLLLQVALCTTAQRRPPFLAKLLYGYRNYWFWENGDRLGTSLGKARPSRDVQLLSKTGEAGKSCARDRLSCSIGHTAACGGFCERAVSRCPMGRSKGCTLRRRRDERENPHQLRESVLGPEALRSALTLLPQKKYPGSSPTPQSLKHL